MSMYVLAIPNTKYTVACVLYLVSVDTVLHCGVGHLNGGVVS